MIIGATIVLYAGLVLSIIVVVAAGFVDGFVKSFKRNAQYPEDLPPDSEIVKMALRWLWKDLTGKARD